MRFLLLVYCFVHFIQPLRALNGLPARLVTGDITFLLATNAWPMAEQSQSTLWTCTWSTFTRSQATAMELDMRDEETMGNEQKIKQLASDSEKRNELDHASCEQMCVSLHDKSLRSNYRYIIFCFLESWSSFFSFCVCSVFFLFFIANESNWTSHHPFATSPSVHFGHSLWSIANKCALETMRYEIVRCCDFRLDRQKIF